MDCGRCGATIEADSRFCRKCGAEQPIAAAADPAADPAGMPPPRAFYDDAARRAAGDSAIGGKTVGWIAAGVLAVAVIANLSGPAPMPAANDSAAMMMPDAMTNDMMAVDAAPTAAPAASPTPVANWDYSTDEDKVRGSTTYLARTVSTNQINQAAPYDGGTSMTLTVRKHPEWGSDVMLSISEGQMMCPSYDGCSGLVRFDDRPARTVRFNGPEDNGSQTIFVEGAADFIAQLKKAKKVTVEKTLYQAGAPQFEFDVAGLAWNH